MLLKKHWGFCLHEAGHVVAQWILAPRWFVSAIVDLDHADCYTRYGHQASALYLAAGRAAKKLRLRIPPPRTLPDEGVLACLGWHPSFPGDHHRRSRPPRRFSDGYHLSMWALWVGPAIRRVHVDRVPDVAAERVRRAGRRADSFVARNEQFIARLAEHLYFHLFLNPEDVKNALTFARRRRRHRPAGK